ncbi:MAG: hypothetical protein LBH19_07310 [Dysgonamonadaceae bacterium]|nr:hypothetical protein [Dysgonamonadaceae bacterium]
MKEKADVAKPWKQADYFVLLHFTLVFKSLVLWTIVVFFMEIPMIEAENSGKVYFALKRRKNRSRRS